MQKIIMAILLLISTVVTAKEEQRKCKMGRDYWLYTPEKIDTSKTYWLVVGVHGAKGNGKGAAGMSSWISKFDNVIVVGPSFPINGPYYQMLGGESDKQLIDIHKDLSKEFKLHEKMFIHGFSGGSQYGHRFALKHPEKLIGISSHSGGTWESEPSNKSEQLIWTISCGLKDTEHSAGAPLTRIQYLRNFYKAMNKKKDFTVKPFVTEAGHSPTKEVGLNAEECFRIASTGMFDYQRAATKDMSATERESWLAKDKKLTEKEFNDGENVYKLMVNQDGWTVGPKALAELAKTRKMLDSIKK